jgi:tRNA(fMet)-specific endonuclease VapC
MRYMLDTNICIYLLKRHPPQVFDRLAKLNVGDVLMSSITLAELRHGGGGQSDADYANDMDALDALLQDIPAMPFDDDAAKAYGVLARSSKLKRKQAMDNLIAAQAISIGAVLVTNNEVDFKNCLGLTVENWVTNA